MFKSFLGVEKSFSNRRWIGPSLEQERLASGLVQKHDISLLTGLILAKRGIGSNEIESYLSPKLRDLMPDPCSLKDMQKASERLLDAIAKQEKICIFADYDVDGTVSASILLLWLKHFNIVPEVYIPDRISEGYGPNVIAMEALSKTNTLIICVDCGTTSHDAIEVANKNYADVLILDHHIGDEQLPSALAIINPKRKDESGELDYICAAGVVFLFLASASRILKERGIQPPDILVFLDLVALATVADVVPLIKFNRALVSQGLKILAKRNRPGLVALIDEAKIQTQPTSYHLGYLIAPRINAAGRLSDAKLAVNLLTANSNFDAIKIARELNELNIERRSLENVALSEAIAQVEIEGKEHTSLIWVCSEKWHPGIIGIIATRLKERFCVPCIVFSLTREDIAIGSARSVRGIDIGTQIKKLVKAGLLISGGGHSMAAGLKTTKSELSKSMKALQTNIEKTKYVQEINSTLQIESLVSVKGASIEIVEEIGTVGPFGTSNPTPIIAISNCQIKYIKVLANKHIKFICSDSTGKRLESIFFNGVETIAGQALLNNVGESFHLCGRLEINDWGGYRRVVLQVEDVATT